MRIKLEKREFIYVLLIALVTGGKKERKKKRHSHCVRCLSLIQPEATNRLPRASFLQLITKLHVPR